MTIEQLIAANTEANVALTQAVRDLVVAMSNSSQTNGAPSAQVQTNEAPPPQTYTPPQMNLEAVNQELGQIVANNPAAEAAIRQIISRSGVTGTLANANNTQLEWILDEARKIQ